MIRSLKNTLRGVRGWIQDWSDRPALPEGLIIERIGTSVEDRAIELISLGKGERMILIFACIHGNEVGTRKTVIELIRWFRLQISLHTQVSLCVIPVLNPDGFERALKQPLYQAGGTVGRCNAHGVDLNRHFSVPSFQSHATWNRGANYQEESQAVFAGDLPGIEPEYQALRATVERLKPHLVVSLHNVGRDVMPNRLEYAQRVAQIFSSATGFSIFPEELWKTLGQTGTAAEWFEQKEVPYLEIELPSRWSSCWSLVRSGFKDLIARVAKD